MSAEHALDAEAIVVGGGVSGLATAFGLKQRGATVSVLDAGARAGGVIGTDIAANAAPDGYTLLIISIAHSVNPWLYKLNYDPIKSFTPISIFATGPNVLAINPTLPVNSVKELVALAKQKPGELNYASAGVGSFQHLGGELFKLTAGVNIVHVPYKGGGPAVIDLIGGHVLMMFSTLPSVLQQVRGGKLRGLAVTGSRRFPAAPEFPTMIEAGIPGFEVSGWSGMFAPAGTPREAVGRLAGETAKILRAPELKERFFVQGAEPVGNSPEEFSAFVKSEIAKWSKVVEASGMRVD